MTHIKSCTANTSARDINMNIYINGAQDHGVSDVETDYITNVSNKQVAYTSVPFSN